MIQRNELDITGIYRYGSNDSDDIDVFISLNRIPDFNDDDDSAMMDEIHETIDYTLKYSGTFTNSGKSIDYSFIHISDAGVVDWCEYDDLAECNNALFYTFAHHPYNNNVLYGRNPIKKKLEQNVSFKIVKVVRTLLTFLSRTEYRKDVKHLLKHGTFKERLEFVLQVVSKNGLSNINSFEKKLDDVEIVKDIAFMFIQLYGLVHEVDVFCKRDACLRFPDLMPYIYKDSEASLEKLEDFIIETFESLSMSIEVYDKVDGVKYAKDRLGCLNKEEQITDLDTKRLQ